MTGSEFATLTEPFPYGASSTPSEMFNFVLIGETAEQIDRLHVDGLDGRWTTFNDGQSCWILQTYLRLACRGFPVTLSADFKRDRINVAFGANLRKMRPRNDVFIVSIRADYPPVNWCHAEIVQNKKQFSEGALWMPLWPQPGLVPRDVSRGNRVERVGYLGRAVNHYTRFFRISSGIFKVREAVRQVCGELGLVFVERGPDTWNDFSDIDAAVALRDFGERTFDTKPASKLVNAWLAGTAFVGGGDSAYMHIGRPEFDFVRATSAVSLKQKLRRLRDDEEFYAALVRRGRCMAAAYDTEAVATYWEFVLSGDIGERYRAWCRNGRVGGIYP